MVDGSPMPGGLAGYLRKGGSAAPTKGPPQETGCASNRSSHSGVRGRRGRLSRTSLRQNTWRDPWRRRARSSECSCQAPPSPLRRCGRPPREFAPSRLAPRALPPGPAEALRRQSEHAGQEAREEPSRQATPQVGRDHFSTAWFSFARCHTLRAAHSRAATISAALARHHWHRAWITNTSR
jgi:hypothetical protein